MRDELLQKKRWICCSRWFFIVGTEWKAKKWILMKSLAKRSYVNLAVSICFHRHKLDAVLAHGINTEKRNSKRNTIIETPQDYIHCVCFAPSLSHSRLFAFSFIRVISWFSLICLCFPNWIRAGARTRRTVFSMDSAICSHTSAIRFTCETTEA